MVRITDNTKLLLLLMMFISSVIVCVLTGQSDMDAFEENLQKSGSFKNHLSVVRVNSPIRFQRSLNVENPSVSYEISSNRNKRDATGEFDEFHSRMTLAARVFAGISIRLGIHDDSIPGDELVAELMKLDSSVKMEDVEKFDKQKVDAFFSDLIAIAITDSSEVQDIETGITNLRECAEMYKKIGNTNDIKPLEDYIDAIKAFDTTALDISSLSRTPIEATILLLNDYKTRQNQNDQVEFVRDLISLQSNLKKLREMSQTVGKIYNLITSHISLIDESLTESDAFRMVQLAIFQARTDLGSVPDASGVSETVKTFEQIGSLNGTYDAIVGQLVGMTGILESQFGQPIVRKHTSGLVNGYNDLTKLSTDAKDSWITSAIDYYDGNMISSELKTLQSLFDKSKTLFSKWSSLNTNKNSQKLKEAEKVLKLFDSTRIMATEGATKMSNISSIWSSPPAISVIKMDDLLISIFEYRKTLTNLFAKISVVWRSAEELAELTKLADYISFTSPTATSELDGVLANMTNFQRIDDLERVLTELKPIKTDLDTYFTSGPHLSLGTLSAKIVKGKPEVKKMFEHTNMPGLLTYFEKVKDSTEDLQTFSEAVQLVQHIREIKLDGDFMNDMKIITQTISNSIPEVTALRSVPSTIKSTVTPGMSELIQLQNFQTESKEFRDAVTVVDKVHTVMQKKDTVEKMMNEGWNVVTAILTVQDRVKQEILRKNWGEYELMWIELSKMMKDLTKRTEQVTQLGSTLSDYGRQFNQFKGLTDLKVDVSKKLEAVELLEKSRPSTPNLADVKEGLKLLKSIRMNFASYDAAVSSADQSINSIILNFQSSSQRSVSSSSAPQVTQNGPPSDSRPQLNNPVVNGDHASSELNSNPENEHWYFEWYSLTGGGIIIVVGSVSITVIVLYFFVWLPKQRQLKEINKKMEMRMKDQEKKFEEKKTLITKNNKEAAAELEKLDKEHQKTVKCIKKELKKKHLSDKKKNELNVELITNSRKKSEEKDDIILKFARKNMEIIRKSYIELYDSEIMEKYRKEYDKMLFENWEKIINYHKQFLSIKVHYKIVEVDGGFLRYEFDLIPIEYGTLLFNSLWNSFPRTDELYHKHKGAKEFDVQFAITYDKIKNAKFLNQGDVYNTKDKKLHFQIFRGPIPYTAPDGTKTYNPICVHVNSCQHYEGNPLKRFVFNALTWKRDRSYDVVSLITIILTENVFDILMSDFDGRGVFSKYWLDDTVTHGQYELTLVDESEQKYEIRNRETNELLRTVTFHIFEMGNNMEHFHYRKVIDTFKKVRRYVGRPYMLLNRDRLGFFVASEYIIQHLSCDPFRNVYTTDLLREVIRQSHFLLQDEEDIKRCVLITLAILNEDNNWEKDMREIMREYKEMTNDEFYKKHDFKREPYKAIEKKILDDDSNERLKKMQIANKEKKEKAKAEAFEQLEETTAREIEPIEQPPPVVPGPLLADDDGLQDAIPPDDVLDVTQPTVTIE